jgi:NAD(P)-dependent dehydrogenase (short-subunit alcohol dehydrogenase family)
MADLSGRVAMVTGANRGIGRATAELLAEAGAAVVVLARSASSAAEVADAINARGQTAMALQSDVTSEADWERVCAATVDRFGRLDILVNNAGVYLRKAIDEQTIEDWRYVQGPNVEGVFLGMKHGIRAMKVGKDRPSGSIVNMSAIGGLIGTPSSTAYGASKGAVRFMSKCAALEVAQLGYDIRINSIHPAIVESDMSDQVVAGYSAAMGEGGDTATAERMIKQNYPMGRFGTAQEIARSILFLAGDDSTFMTGADLVVDGGYTAR